MERKFYWQPELPIAIIYWSVTFSCLFLSFILALEKSKIHWKSYLAFSIFLFLFFLSRRRFLRFSSEGIEISYLLPWKKEEISYQAIEEIRWENNRFFCYYKGKVFECYFTKKQAKIGQKLLASNYSIKKMKE